MRVINFVSIDLIGAAKLITVDFKSAKLDKFLKASEGKTHHKSKHFRRDGNNHGSLDELSALV